MNIECKLVPPPKVEERISLNLDLSMEEALRIQGLFGNVTGGGPIRDTFDEIYGILYRTTKKNLRYFKSSAHINTDA